MRAIRTSLRSTQQKIPDRAEWHFESIPDAERISCCQWELCRESCAARELAALLRRANGDSERLFRSLEEKQRQLSPLADEYLSILGSEYFPLKPWGRVPKVEKRLVAKHLGEPEECRVAWFYELDQYSKYATRLLRHGWSKHKLRMSHADAEVERGRYVTFFIPRFAGREAFERVATEFTQFIPKRSKKRTATPIFRSNPRSLLTGITLIRLKGAKEERSWKEVRTIAKSNDWLPASDRHISRLVRQVRTALQHLNTALAPQPIDNEAVTPADESFDPEDL